MSTDDDIYGASASIDIRFGGSLRQLTDKIANALNLHEFDVEVSEYPPHEEVASAEAMGWEAWLSAVPSQGFPCYRLELETEHSVTEAFHGKMHDLSPWLARLITSLCDVESAPTRPSS